MGVSARLVHCGWLGCPYLGATLSVLSRFILRRRTTGTFAVRRAIWPAGWVRWRTRTPPRKSGFPQPLKAMLSGFHLLWSLPVAHTEAGKIRGTRFGAVSCTKKWISDSFLKEFCGSMLVHPRKQRCTPVRPDSARSTVGGWSMSTLSVLSRCFQASFC